MGPTHSSQAAPQQPHISSRRVLFRSATLRALRDEDPEIVACFSQTAVSKERIAEIFGDSTPPPYFNIDDVEILELLPTAYLSPCGGSRVYRTMWKGREVALRFFPPMDIHRDADKMEPFLLWFGRYAALPRHENRNQILGMALSETFLDPESFGTPFPAWCVVVLEEELCDGPDLASLLLENRGFPLKERLEIMHEVASAVSEMHEHEVRQVLLSADDIFLQLDENSKLRPVLRNATECPFIRRPNINYEKVPTSEFTPSNFDSSCFGHALQEVFSDLVVEGVDPTMLIPDEEIRTQLFGLIDSLNQADECMPMKTVKEKLEECCRMLSQKEEAGEDDDDEEPLVFTMEKDYFPGKIRREEEKRKKEEKAAAAAAYEAERDRRGEIELYFGQTRTHRPTDYYSMEFDKNMNLWFVPDVPKSARANIRRLKAYIRSRPEARIGDDEEIALIWWKFPHQNYKAGNDKDRFYSAKKLQWGSKVVYTVEKRDND